jgi:hypothetical protein
MGDALEDLLQRYKEKQVELYERIERELKKVKQVVRLVHIVPTMPSTPSSSQTADLEDEPTLQGELGIWITLPEYKIKFLTPSTLQDSPNLDVEVNLKGIPPEQVEVVEASLKVYKRE